MVRSRAVYEDVLWLEPIYSDDRLTAYAVAGRDVLLVFRKGATGQTVTLASGSIPGHGGDGALRSSGRTIIRGGPLAADLILAWWAAV